MVSLRAWIQVPTLLQPGLGPITPQGDQGLPGLHRGQRDLTASKAGDYKTSMWGMQTDHASSPWLEDWDLLSWKCSVGLQGGRLCRLGATPSLQLFPTLAAGLLP